MLSGFTFALTRLVRIGASWCGRLLRFFAGESDIPRWPQEKKPGFLHHPCPKSLRFPRNQPSEAGLLALGTYS